MVLLNIHFRAYPKEIPDSATASFGMTPSADAMSRSDWPQTKNYLG